MKISIITPTYSSQETLTDTIESIIAQNYSDLEYIVVDGASTDSTQRILEEYRERIPMRIICEPDEGIFDAMNKGVRMATGDIVGILNSDDFYHSNTVLQKVRQRFESDPAIDAVYGDLVYVDRKNSKKQTRYWKAGEYDESKLSSGWMIPHPTLFIKKEIYQKLEKIFDTQFSIAADYELILRLLKVHKIRVSYTNEILVTMREGGTGSSSIMQRIRGWNESKRAWTVNGLKTPPFYILRRVFGKVSQFWMR